MRISDWSSDVCSSDLEAPSDIITGNKRTVMLEHREGIRFYELDRKQQDQFMQLLNVYVGNFREEFSEEFMEKLEGAGMDSLCFALAGSLEPGIGKAHYYRIPGPVLLIEYDKTQHKANQNRKSS